MAGNPDDTIWPEASADAASDNSPNPHRWLITGASGRVGRCLRERLARPDRTLRLLDIVAPEPALPGERVETVTASLDDADAVRMACADVDAIVHLGGHAKEQSWEEILRANVEGTRCLFEAAREHGIRPIVLASSSHAVGCWTRSDAGPNGLPADIAGRPDTYYGWSKLAMESLGQLYAERYPMSVTCVRIGTVLPRPHNVRALSTWLSYDDAARLVEAAVAASEPGVRYVWGISANSRRWWSLAEGEKIAYFPVDDSEDYAEQVLAEAGEAEDDPRAGHDWVDRPLGEPIR